MVALCPQLRFKDVVKRDLKRTGIGYTIWEFEAEDHDNWKSLVKDTIVEGEEDRRKYNDSETPKKEGT